MLSAFYMFSFYLILLMYCYQYKVTLKMLKYYIHKVIEMVIYFGENITGEMSNIPQAQGLEEGDVCKNMLYIVTYNLENYFSNMFFL